MKNGLWLVLVKPIKMIGIGLAIVVFGAIALNEFVRVADGQSESDIGIIEHWVFGRSIWSAVFSSNSLALDTFISNNRHDVDLIGISLKNVNDIARIIGTNGTLNLLEDAKLEQERARAESMSLEAYEAAIEVAQKGFVRQNLGTEFEHIFITNLIPALNDWHRGLVDKNSHLIEKGIENYQKFTIAWQHLAQKNGF